MRESEKSIPARLKRAYNPAFSRNCDRSSPPTQKKSRSMYEGEHGVVGFVGEEKESEKSIPARLDRA